MNRKWKSYASEFHFLFKTGHYQVKLAESSDELRQLFRLRYKVFVQEWGNTRVALPLLEVDEYDWNYDHLIITHDKNKESVIATCRLKLVKDYRLCYTSSYYSLSSFFNTFPGNKVEMGRLCIDTKFRKLPILFLIWRGLAKYLFQTQSDYLFGVASIPSHPEKFVEDIQSICQYFKEENHLDAYLNLSLKNFDKDLCEKIQRPSNLSKEEMHEKAKKRIPPLLQFYLGQGAKICSMPSWDKNFNCIDFVTILNKKCLPQNQLKKYFN